MPLFFADGRPFVTGWQSHVFYAPTSAEPKARLVLRVALEGLTTQAMVDTGGLYLFCMPSVARALHLDATQALGAQTILFRDERRIPSTLVPPLQRSKPLRLPSGSPAAAPPALRGVPALSTSPH